MVTDANCKLQGNKLIINDIFVVCFKIYIYVAGNLANVTAERFVVGIYANYFEPH